MTDIIKSICQKHNIALINFKRFSVGQGNFVFKINSENQTYVLRLNEHPYNETIKLLKDISELEINVSDPIFTGKEDKYFYMICNYIDGKDLGLVYKDLSDFEKRTIAEEVTVIQNKVASLPVLCEFNAIEWINHMLERAKERIRQNGWFDTQKAENIGRLLPYFDDYFFNLKPVTYLDDISTKNLLINDGHVSGIIDIDWIEHGDPLTFIALTNVALMDMECDTDYVSYLLSERKTTELEYKVFLLYSLIYCVDFMGERGCTFNGKVVEVNIEIVDKLNRIYENLLSSLSQQLH